LIALAAIVVVGMSLAAGHRLAVDSRRLGRAALATARAREAAATGIALSSAGVGLSGSLPGGSQWTVVDDTTANGDRILWSLGSTLLPVAATLEAAALLARQDSAHPVQAIRRWVVMRR